VLVTRRLAAIDPWWYFLNPSSLLPWSLLVEVLANHFILLAGMTNIPLISIVDDDDTVRAATESLVKSLGYETRTFASADSFLQSSSLSETRCMILDVQMPNMSGLELQECLSNLGFEIPIIFMTAYPDDAVRQRALQAGAVAFLLKPFEIHGQRFMDSVLEALKKKKGSMP
jgi:FixJ family two-component response regulator